MDVTGETISSFILALHLVEIRQLWVDKHWLGGATCACGFGNGIFGKNVGEKRDW